MRKHLFFTILSALTNTAFCQSVRFACDLACNCVRREIVIGKQNVKTGNRFDKFSHSDMLDDVEFKITSSLTQDKVKIAATKAGIMFGIRVYSASGQIMHTKRTP